MNRRTFCFGFSQLSAMVPALLGGQVLGPSRGPARIETSTPGATPAIALSHIGFLPKARKVLVYCQTGGKPPAEFTLRSVGDRQPSAPPFRPVIRQLTKVASDLGDCLVGDFSDLEREEQYEIAVGNERSVPFFVRSDVWRRTLPKAVSYFSAQRCGVAVPYRHPACHLDDGRRRDTGEHVDTTGGWHSAGDLVKSGTTMTIAIGLLHLAKNLGERWDLAGAGLQPLLDEIRWGNRYFLKIQDADGLVWNDTGLGLNGDNSDNHWTDNIAGTGDDRYINTHKTGLFQAMFITMQALIAQVFREVDTSYGERCLAAAVRCWDAYKEADLKIDPRYYNFWDSTTELGWRTLAVAELYRATGRDAHRVAAAELGRQLLSLQTREFVASQKMIRGFWRTAVDDPTPSVDPAYAAMRPLALLELSLTFPGHPDVSRWRDAVRLHLDEYVLPLSARSAFGIVPYGVFLGSPTPEYYRPLAGGLTYRYFMPVRKLFWWVGLTPHLEAYAILLAMAAKAYGRREYRDLAYQQLEWVMGANPFGACLMTGEGARNPYAYSPWYGPIPGGIMNGIAGNTQDEPVLDFEYGYLVDSWRTREYWGPQSAFYIWALSVLESA
jgi:hypothetical protein